MPATVKCGVERIVAIGDLHGNYQGLMQILSHLDLIDRGGHWQGQDTHVVQLGDVLGRGGEPGKIFALLRRLEREAAEAGGAVHLLLGNHEVMTLRGTLVYNTPAEFQDIADWAPSAFGPLLDGAVTASPDWTPVTPVSPSEKYQKRLAMLGCDVFERYLRPDGPIGEWLIQHPTALVLGDTLFVHGGLNRRHGLMDLDILNQEVRDEILAARREPGRSQHLVKDGPQWNREYTVGWSKTREQELQDVLDYHGCTRMVVGHTPTGAIAPLRTGEVLPLYEGKLWCVDTGIGEAYGGYLGALSLEAGKVGGLYP